MVRETHHLARRTAARVVAACVSILLLVLASPIVALAQQDDALVRRLVEARTEETRAQWEKDLGKITGEQYRSRYNAAHERFLSASRDRNKLPPDRRDRVRKQYESVFKIQITPMVQQWNAELLAQKDAKNQTKRQAEADMHRDIPVAAQLQVKRTKLRQQRDKGQITEQAFKTQDKAAEQQLLAMANKHAATGFGGTFAGLAAVEAEKILKREAQAVARKTPPAGGGDFLRFEDMPPDQQARILESQRQQRLARKTESTRVAMMIWGIIGAGVLLVGFLVFRGKRPKPGSRLPPLSTHHGSASFADFRNAPLSPAMTIAGVFLGKISTPAFKDEGLDVPTAPVVTTPEHHTLIVGRTRTGKGTRVIVPTLLRFMGSMFVIDPKGENAAVTARTRRDTWRQAVHIVNPWGVLKKEFDGKGFKPATYNPLDILDRNDPNVVATARRLANAICPVTGKSDDIFWQKSAAQILAAVFLWLADQPGEAKTLARAREIVTLSRKKFTEQFLTKMVVSSAFDGAIKEMVGNLVDLADNTYTGITANLVLTTDFISDPQLKKATNASTFSMTEFRDKPMTVFLVIPPDQIEAQKTWLRLMIAATVQTYRQRPPGGKRISGMMLLDEFPALGKLQDLPTDLATMSGYGLDFTLIAQGIDQLKAIYDKDAGTILNNCAWKWYCNVTDLEGAKHVSESLGEATVRTEGKSFSTGESGKGTSASESTTFGEKGRRLLTPDEVINLGRDVAIGFQPKGLPLYLKPIDYWDLTQSFAHYAQVPELKTLFWHPPLQWDANPYVAGSGAETGEQPGGGPSQGSGPNPGSSQSQSGQSGTRPPPGGGSSGSGNSGQSQSGPRPPPKPPPMSAEEARAVLGVGPKATKKEIQAAYKRLMTKVHPDHEGSTYLAQKINEARQVLVK
jgi:type IV secretory pathway TraG/TraD family ATPase VirD4